MNGGLMIMESVECKNCECETEECVCSLNY